MIITRTRGAIVTNPARRAGTDPDAIIRRHRARLEERPHKVEPYTRKR